MEMRITKIEELKKALRLDGLTSEQDYEDAFNIIANALLNRFAINKDGQIFRFVEIEFYHSKSAEGGTTYQRQGNEGLWFFHKSGVDINFLSNGDSYGGILIRSIQKPDGIFVPGPYNVVDVLFDKFDAFEQPKDFPVIVPADDLNIEPVQSLRYNIGGTKKYRFTWTKECWNKEKCCKNYSAYPWNYKGELK